MGRESHPAQRVVKACFYTFFFAGFCIATIVTAMLFYSLTASNMPFGVIITKCGLLAIFWYLFYDFYRHVKSWKL